MSVEDGIQKWSRSSARYNLDKHDCIIDFDLLNDSSFVLATSQGKLIKDSVSVDTFFVYPLALGTIYAVSAASDDRIFIHDNNLKCLLAVTPEEMLDYHIGANEFDLALEVARKYTLDTDYVLKSEWNFSLDINHWEISILSKVQDRKWVLETCLKTFPNSIATIKQMYTFGLSLTSHLNSSIIESEVEMMLENMEDVTGKSNGLTSLDLYLYRIQFLERMDRLSTFESLFMGSILSGSSFDISHEFQKFISTSLLDFAKEKAKECHFEALDLLLTRHGSLLLPHHESILDNIPVIIDPVSYSSLLPSKSAFKCTPWRKDDWSESKNLLEFAAMIHDSISYLEPYAADTNVLESNLEWFKKRIFEIESAGQTLFAFNLCKFAVTAGYIELASTSQNLLLMSALTDIDAKKYCDLHEFERIPKTECIDEIILHSSSSNIVGTLTDLVFPYWISSELGNEKLEECLLRKLQNDPDCFVQVLQALVQCDSDKINISIETIVKSFSYALDFDAATRVPWSDVIAELSKKPNQRIQEPEGWGDNFDDFDVDMDVVDSEIPSYIARLQTQVEFFNFLATHGHKLDLGQVQKLEFADKGKLFLSKLLRQSTILLDAQSTDNDWNMFLDNTRYFLDRKMINQVTETDLYTEMILFALGEASMIAFVINL